MNVLLIQPTLTTRTYNKRERPTTYEPLGLAYLAAVLREAAHHVEILDCYAEGCQHRKDDAGLTRFGLPDKYIQERIANFAPDVVGITCMFTGHDRDCRRLAALAKTTVPNAWVIVGGADASAQSEALIEDPNIDLIIRGEGEAVLLEVLNHLASTGSVPKNLPGTTVAGSANPLADLIPDLDALPFPARDLLPMHLYLDHQREVMPYVMHVPVGTVVSSRGCQYNCNFCSSTKLWRGWRPRSAPNVVDEIEMLVNDYGVREIAFQDDSFISDPDRVKRICEEIARRKLRISWTVPPGLNVWKMDEATLRMMRDTGFYRANFPIESGDPEILRYIRKPIDLDAVRQSIEMCHRLGLWTYGNFLIGFPEETAQSIEKTARFAETCGLDMVVVYIVQPYAGSDLFEEYKSLGLLDTVHTDASSTWYSTYDTKYFKAEELRAKRDEIQARFTKARIRRLLSIKGLNDLRKKMGTPERFGYALRTFATFGMASLKSRKFSTLTE